MNNHNAIIANTTTLKMITSKQSILKIIAETSKPYNLNRNEKFQVFANVCDNMLAEGRITAAKHKQWTEVF